MRYSMVMLEFLKRRKLTPQRLHLPSVGQDQRVYAIGDVHGRLDLLVQLIALIEDDHHQRGGGPIRLVLLGDLIDRGPQSAQVIDYVMDLSRSGIALTLLMGNHEDMFLQTARGDQKLVRFFCRMGGMDTLASYGLSEMYQAKMSDDQLAAWMLRHIPRAHVDFVEGFEDSLIIGDYLFVHAGIRPGIAIKSQQPADLRWIRNDFLDHTALFDHMIVHGHTITADVDERANRIGIDTGAYYSGRLTAIGLHGEARWFLSTPG